MGSGDNCEHNVREHGFVPSRGIYVTKSKIQPAALLILTKAKQFAFFTRTIVAALLSARARIRTWDLYNVNVAL